MKKLVPLLLLATFLTACGGDTPIGGDSENDGTYIDPNINHDNPREYYTAEEVTEMINKSENMKVSDEYFYSLVPKSFDHVSEFYQAYGKPLPEKEALDEFLAVYGYLFPEHELNKNCLYYMSPLPTDPKEVDVYFDENGNRIRGENYFASLGLHPIYDRKYYNMFLRGELGNPKTSAFFSYDEQFYENENSVSLTMRSPFGNDICYFNKGVAQKIFENLYNGETKFYAWGHFTPNDSDVNFEYVGCFTPDSEESFMLLDKEISVKDAVRNFEDYIASIPGVSVKVFGMHVDKVYVYKADSEHYYYWFRTAPIYDGIPFNEGASGGMIKSDDVDYIYGTYLAWRVLEETPHTEIIPFEEAVKITSEKMTGYVEFKVEETALVYRTGKNVSGNDGVGEGRYPVAPVWRFIMSNPNDERYYHAYVNALTGEFDVETSKR